LRDGTSIAVVIPALDEQEAIGKVVSAIPDWIDDIVVVDNGSSDGTAEVAAAEGARVIREPRRGYGSACLAGIAALNDPDVVVFMDGDLSDYPEEVGELVAPILSGEADMVVGSRVLGRREPGALTFQARFGNLLACILLRLLWKVRYTDLGPFRAISRDALTLLEMKDPDFGWTVEMQAKAARQGLRTREVPVSYRKRTGKSKISGTLKGSTAAGAKILFTILTLALGQGKSQMVQGRLLENLIIFTRYPEASKTKTRLVPALGAEGAAALQRRMTERLVMEAREFARNKSIGVEVWFEGGGESLMRRWLGGGLRYIPQRGGDLGDRMGLALTRSFRAGARRAVIVGTDCPGVTAGLMRSAFEALRDRDVVLGPAADGGYYLVGVRGSAVSRAVPAIFENVPWGACTVLDRTLNIAEDAGLSSELLETLDDVDRPEDLSVWQSVLESHSAATRPERVSVIIPALDEAANVAASLDSAMRGDNVEVIVVCGDAKDDTSDIARSWEAKVVSSSPGRGRQMNAGASRAAGEILLFLHADTVLPEGFDDHIRRVLRKRGVSGGAFSLRLDGPALGLRLTERLATLRSRLFQMPYGDQAIFVKTEIFRRVGGFPEIPIMEDIELVRRLRRLGRIVISGIPVVTSARRWFRLGTYRATIINHIAIIAHCIGVPVARIARWYYSVG